MKILIYSDVHWSTSSSLVRMRGTKYSMRLEHLLDSMNWVNQVAVDKKCDFMICAGDFMDKAQLTDEEITALQDIKWNNLSCYFLCGNHESSVNDLRYSSLKAVESPEHIIVDKPYFMQVSDGSCNVFFMPYVVESDRQPLSHYLESSSVTHDKPLIVVSHNDIAGINYGGFESKIGFHVTEIDAACDLYLNGHLHNTEWVKKGKILNVGSFMAHNFTNDSSRYKYGLWILDTETLSLEFMENPYGFTFYKIDVNSEADIRKLTSLSNNAVVSVKCNEKVMPSLKESLKNIANRLIDSRTTVVRDLNVGEGETTIVELQSDHLAKFVTLCNEKIENSKALQEELAEICK